MNQSALLATFEVHPRRKYDFTAAVLRKPMVWGSFSVDAKRTYCDDKRNLSFINVDFEDTKPVDYDLRVAMDLHILKLNGDPCNEKLDQLLTWILKHRDKFHTVDSKGKPLQSLSTDFVCFRGMLSDLLKTVYERSDGWILCATKYKGTIYLCEFQTPESIEHDKNETPEQKAFCCWGYKFEQYMTEGCDVKKGVNENEEFCCVVRSRLETHSLLYGAEMDGADPTMYTSDHADFDAFVELKTSKLIQNERDMSIFQRYKLRNYWCQSFLVGVPRVIVGFRNEEGVVKKLQCLSVANMPSYAQSDTRGSYWLSNVMMNFVNQFLFFIKKQVVFDDPRVVYKFERASHGGDILCTFEGCDSQWSFLPAWYYDEVFRAPSD